MGLFNFFEKKIKNSNKNENSILPSQREAVSGIYNWQIVDNENIPNEAKILHQEARQLSGQGKYDEGIAKLKDTHQLVPNWAYPIYDLAYTYLLKQDYENALKYYELTDKLAPKGFFTTKTAYWSLKKEAAGIFPRGMYLNYLQIEWLSSEEEKLNVAHNILERCPDYAPAWKEIAEKGKDPNNRLEAIRKGLALNPDLETKGILLINRAIIYDILDNNESAENILDRLIISKETTLANIEMAKFMLKSLEAKG